VIEFRVLGPLEAVGPSGSVALGAGKQRLLLAILVLHAGELVSRSVIIDALWPEDPPGQRRPGC
jgi:DNA-binding SARP family transcriptional activator